MAVSGAFYLHKSKTGKRFSLLAQKNLLPDLEAGFLDVQFV
jgi:hypothetical protein